MKELSRTAWETGTRYILNCQVCGKEIRLYFNSGYLDESRCCNYIYSLEAPRTNFVVYKVDENV